MSSDRGGEDEGVGAPEKSRPWTPGPWRAHRTGEGWEVDPVVGVGWDIYGGEDGEIKNKADANLISAAPDLYEALEAALSLLDDVARRTAGMPDILYPDARLTFEQGRIALKKARGE